MGLLHLIWNKLTFTKALDESSGYFETAFFESVYRVIYLTGFSSRDRGLYLIYSKGIMSMVMIFVMSELWYLFSSSELDSIIDNVNVTLIHLIAMYRYVNMMKNSNIYNNLAKAMEAEHFDVSTVKRKNIIDFWIKRNEFYLKLLLGLGSCTLAAWYVYPLVDDIEYNLMVAVRLPFDYKNPVRYTPTYIVTLVSFHYTSYFVMMNDLIMQAYLMQLLCQFDVLGDCFENILMDCASERNSIDTWNTDFYKRYERRLKDLVDQHKFILNNTQELRRVLKSPMLYQFAASSMLICFAAYQVTATVSLSITKFLMSLLYLSYNMFELFIFCKWCDEIKIQSERLRDSVYRSGWESGIAAVPGVRSSLMLVAARATYPLVLTAGGLYDLSLSSYATIIKTSYSALTVLLRVRR